MPPTAAATTNNRDTFLLDMGNNKVVQLNLKTASLDETLRPVLGYTINSDGKVPDGKVLVGTNKEEAMRSGAVPVILRYKAASGKLQSAKVLCSPAKADTVFADAVGKTYNGRPIMRVGFPRRRVYSF